MNKVILFGCFFVFGTVSFAQSITVISKFPYSEITRTVDTGIVCYSINNPAGGAKMDCLPLLKGKSAGGASFGRVRFASIVKMSDPETGIICFAATNPEGGADIKCFQN